MPNGKGNLECCYCKYWRSESGYQGYDSAYEDGKCTYHQVDITGSLPQWVQRICQDFSPNQNFESDNLIGHPVQTQSLNQILEMRFSWFEIELEPNVLYGFDYPNPAGIRKLMEFPRLMRKPGKGKRRIMYIELKTGYGDSGPARIG